jgi:4'-phosphopantetheinyl transferase EntD
MAACRIAVMDTGCLPEVASECTYLTHAETATYRSLRTPQRRRAWLAARLAAKYLFLLRLEFAPAQKPSRRPILLELEKDRIDEFPRWMYQSVEVLAAAGGQDGAPRLRWCGRDASHAVSLSHKGEQVCACLGENDPVGIDLERVEARVAAFYRLNYSVAETVWIGQAAGGEPSRRKWLYTLLWTVKEAALKAGIILQRSPLSFAGIGVDGLPPAHEILWAFRNGTWGDRLGSFTARLQEERNTTGVYVAFAGTARLILSVVRPLDSLATNSSAVLS